MSEGDPEAAVEQAVRAFAVKVAAIIVLVIGLLLAFATPLVAQEYGTTPETMHWLLLYSAGPAALVVFCVASAFWLCRQGRIHSAAALLLICLPVCIYLVMEIGP